jgi:hypothetical protein
MPFEDLAGHQDVIQMLLYSLEAGAYAKDHKQLDTIHKLWSSLFECLGGSARGMLFNISTGKEDRRKNQLTQRPTDYVWFWLVSAWLQKADGPRCQTTTN